MRFFTAAITLTWLLLSAEAANITQDARCGPYGKGQTCLNSIWGSCCSQHGWCGSIDAYCGKGCQPGFGTCKSTTQPVSKNARCGAGFDEQTCRGSKFGDCCSKFSWCGVTYDHCRLSSCQKGYGRCGPVSSSIRSNVAMDASVATSLRSPSSSSAQSAISVHTSYLSILSSASTSPSHSSSSSELLSTPSSDSASLPLSSSISELTYRSSSTYSDALVSTVIKSSSTATYSFTPPSIKPITLDGRCGASYGGQTCQGYPDYPCCSIYNWCGIGYLWCAPERCQKEYGKCDSK